MKKIRLLIVDDSMLIRAMFTEMLKAEPDIEVVGAAVDPYDAREKIKRLNPDVITLDVEMPKMNGIVFLEKIMSLRPMPVIMISSLTERGADITLQALEIGAVDYLTKPSTQTEITLLALKEELAEKIRHAAQARVTSSNSAPPAPRSLGYHGDNTHLLIAIGSSTGGVEALRDILQVLPSTMPPIVITQHMPASFTASFAARLDTICALRVHEAHHLQRLEPGNAYLAPGDKHMEVHGSPGQWTAHIIDGPLVSGHKPSVDVLFRSVAKHAGERSVGVILTGMGRDGAAGLLAMRERGARTIGQSEATCVVYGMPKVANQLGAVEMEAPLHQIPDKMIHFCEAKGKK